VHGVLRVAVWLFAGKCTLLFNAHFVKLLRLSLVSLSRALSRSLFSLALSLAVSLSLSLCLSLSFSLSRYSYIGPILQPLGRSDVDGRESGDTTPCRINPAPCRMGPQPRVGVSDPRGCQLFCNQQPGYLTHKKTHPFRTLL
jgi:hypothetical protein